MSKSCPMTKEICEKYGLSDSQVKWFCDIGYSVECDVWLKKWLSKKKIKKFKKTRIFS